MDRAPTLGDLSACFEGAVPAVIATASADGIPNITYLSRVRRVDDERVALSNQFFSKTARNLAENPRASVLVIDPTTYAEYRLTLAYERTDRRGSVFDRLREDVDLVAALSGMQDVFKLRAADIYRVVAIDPVPGATGAPRATDAGATAATGTRAPIEALAELAARFARCPDLDALVGTAVDGLAALFGYEHSVLMLLDERGSRLYTIASHGYSAQGVGSEVTVGEGMLGMVAARCTPIRLGAVDQDAKYSRSVRRSYEDSGEIGPGREVPVPGLPDARSRIAVPAMAQGELVGVLMIESPHHVAFGPDDEALLSTVAALVASGVELARERERDVDSYGAQTASPDAAPPAVENVTHVRFFTVDGSTFLDGDYLIKGVAGRILWSLLDQHEREGRVDFTNREVRLDPSLELPGLRDNFESRLILLKRRLDERSAPVRIDKTGRGRFRLVIERPLRLDAVTGADG